MSKRGMLKAYINAILMKIFMISLWIGSIICVILDTGLWIPTIMMIMKIIFNVKSIYEDVQTMKIDMELYEEENKR